MMAEGMVEDEWTRTASIMALIANCHRDDKKRTKPYTPNDFNPFGKKRTGETWEYSKENWQDCGRMVKSMLGQKGKTKNGK